MTMNRRERRAFRAQWDQQINWERNATAAGQSYIPAEIAEGMTKPKDETLWQVVVSRKTETGHQPLVVGPAMIRDAAGTFAEAINKMVAAGREKTWTNAIVVPVTPINAAA